MGFTPIILMIKLLTTLLASVTLILGIACSGPETTESGSNTRKPNIILIMADDLGYETLGTYGGASYDTPVLDRLAANGVRFDHAHAQPLCTPTRVSLMTGKYNWRNWHSELLWKWIGSRYRVQCRSQHHRYIYCGCTCACQRCLRDY